MTSSTNIFGFPVQNGFDSCSAPAYPYIGGKTPQLATCIRNCPGFHLWIKTHPCKRKPLVLSVFQMLFQDSWKEQSRFLYRWDFLHIGTHNSFCLVTVKGRNLLIYSWKNCCYAEKKHRVTEFFLFLKRLDAETERLCKIFMKDGENCLMFFKNKNEKNRKTNKKTIKRW